MSRTLRGRLPLLVRLNPWLPGTGAIIFLRSFARLEHQRVILRQLADAHATLPFQYAQKRFAQQLATPALQKNRDFVPVRVKFPTDQVLKICRGSQQRRINLEFGG